MHSIFLKIERYRWWQNNIVGQTIPSVDYSVVKEMFIYLFVVRRWRPMRSDSDVDRKLTSRSPQVDCVVGKRTTDWTEVRRLEFMKSDARPTPIIRRTECGPRASSSSSSSTRNDYSDAMWESTSGTWHWFKTKRTFKMFLRSRLKAASDGADWIEDGRAVHARSSWQLLRGTRGRHTSN